MKLRFCETAAPLLLQRAIRSRELKSQHHPRRRFVTRFALPQFDLGYRPLATHCRSSFPGVLADPPRASPRIGWQRLRAEYSRIIDRVPRSHALPSSPSSPIVIPRVDFRSDRESVRCDPVMRVVPRVSVKRDRAPSNARTPCSLFRVQRHRRYASTYVLLGSLTSLGYERAVRDIRRADIRG